MKCFAIYIFSSLIILSSVIYIWFIKNSYSGVDSLANSVTEIFLTKHDKPYLTNEGEIWLNDFRKCAGIINKETNNKDSLNQELLEDIFATMEETPMNLFSINNNNDTCIVEFKVNLSKSFSIRLWLIEKDKIMLLHRIDGLCSLYSHIRKSK
jgi:hypothetical protein